jgi:hypothetical protein
MKRRALVSLLISLLAFVSAQAQDTPETATRPRMVQTSPTPQAAPPASTTPAQTVTPSQTNVQPKPVPTQTGSLPPANNAAANLHARSIGVEKIRARITEAERLLKSRPVPTSLTSSTPSAPSIDFVTIAALETGNGKMHFITMPKVLFLKKGAEANITTSEGMLINLRVIRANGVNTALAIFDTAGRSLMPLVVQYPIERGGKFLEMAYYTSVHPALLAPDVVKAGQSYVRTMLDLAAKRLQLKGKRISPDIINVAERLCVVEHTDHERYRKENRLALYEEIFALFALNELDTYRYAVSWAGAGGMVQMIPSTYRMVRTAHPGVGLNPDFVAGMRNHGNALEAMLLYMQDTWDDLSANEEVIYALNAKIATQTELLAAGYNSNPARLPGYLKRGGTAWRTLIPRETQLYLQIYRSLESLIPIKART